MKKKILLSVAVVGGLACGHLLAAPAAKSSAKTTGTTVQVFDPFQLTTVTATVSGTATTSDIGTVPISTEPTTVVGSLVIGQHHKPWHKTKKKPHPNPPGNDNGGGPQP